MYKLKLRSESEFSNNEKFDSDFDFTKSKSNFKLSTNKNQRGKNFTSSLAIFVFAVIFVINCSFYLSCVESRYLPTRSDSTRTEQIKQLLQELLEPMALDNGQSLESWLSRLQQQQQLPMSVNQRIHDVQSVSWPPGQINRVHGGPNGQIGLVLESQQATSQQQKRTFEPPHFLSDESH